MKALVLEKNATLVCREVPAPQKPGSEWYLVRVVAAGICGSDIHRGFENGAYHYPLIMGHEFSGVIEQATAGSKYAVGTRMAVFPLLPCRKCIACRTGDFAQCANYDYLGSRRDGGFAEYVWVPEENLFPLPDHVDIVHAAMTEPCAVALHGVRKLTTRGGETTAVYGAGPIGNMAAQWLRIRGCGTVIVVDIDDSKLAIAEQMGFATVNPKKQDPVAAIRELSGKDGADKVVEACGIPLTYRQAVQSAGTFGEVVFLGNISGDFILPPKDVSSILRKELSIHGTWNSKVTPRGLDDWSTVLKYMGKELVLGPLISHTPTLEEGPAVFEGIVSKKMSINKVVFKIG
jgi:L-iditol 2-dehydrogenase